MSSTTLTEDKYMPHCIIEYAKPIESQVHPETLLKAVHETVSGSELFEPANVRSRVKAFDTFMLGAEQNNFIHITIKILQGRTDEQKSLLTKSVTDAINALSLSDIAVSCECMDIHTASYQRLSL